MSEDEKQEKNGPEIAEGEQTRKAGQQVPVASFQLFISSLATQPLINLGEMEDPLNKKRGQALDQAKFTIDTLQIIKDKTVGNLTDDEAKYLDILIYDLRMRYVERAK